MCSVRPACNDSVPSCIKFNCKPRLWELSSLESCIAILHNYTQGLIGAGGWGGVSPYSKK